MRKALARGDSVALNVSIIYRRRQHFLENIVIKKN